MPEGKGSFNPVFFMEPEDDRISSAVKSPEFIPVGVHDSDYNLVTA